MKCAKCENLFTCFNLIVVILVYIALKRIEKERRERYAAELDAKMLNDEIKASAARKHGANPEIHANIKFPTEVAPSTYKVEGSGASKVDGTYSHAGYKNWVPYYKHSDSNLFLMRTVRDEKQYWFISDSEKFDKPDGDYYCMECEADTPPLSGWGLTEDCLDGELPAPSITEICHPCEPPSPGGGAAVIFVCLAADLLMSR